MPRELYVLGMAASVNVDVYVRRRNTSRCFAACAYSIASFVVPTVPPNSFMARRPSAGSFSLVTSTEPLHYNGLASASSNPPSSLPTHHTRRPSGRSASTSQKLDTLINVSDMDPDDLFVRHNVSEVRMIQQRLRCV